MSHLLCTGTIFSYIEWLFQSHIILTFNIISLTTGLILLDFPFLFTNHIELTFVSLSTMVRVLMRVYEGIKI